MPEETKTPTPEEQNRKLMGGETKLAEPEKPKPEMSDRDYAKAMLTGKVPKKV